MIEAYNTWYNYVPYFEEGDTANIGSGVVQYMVDGPTTLENHDNGSVKLRWRADIVDPGEFVTYYGYRRPIPERYFATPEGLEEWVHSAAQEFCSEYEYYPLSWGFYTEERKKDDPKDEVIGVDPIEDPVKESPKGDPKLDEPAVEADTKGTTK